MAAALRSYVIYLPIQLRNNSVIQKEGNTRMSYLAITFLQKLVAWPGEGN